MKSSILFTAWEVAAFICGFACRDTDWPLIAFFAFCGSVVMLKWVCEQVKW